MTHGPTKDEVGSTPPTLHLPFVTDPALIACVRRLIEAFAEAAGLSHADAGDVGLCVNEAIANVIRHAYAGVPDRPVVLDAVVDGGRLTVRLRDWGNGKKPDIEGVLSHATAPTDATLRPGGLGLPCLKRLLDEVAFEPQPDGMSLRMVKLRD